MAKGIVALEKAVRDVAMHLYFSLSKQYGKEKAKKVMRKVLFKIADEFNESGEDNVR